jgi:hypothetical protein
MGNNNNIINKMNALHFAESIDCEHEHDYSLLNDNDLYEKTKKKQSNNLSMKMKKDTDFLF